MFRHHLCHFLLRHVLSESVGSLCGDERFCFDEATLLQSNFFRACPTFLFATMTNQGDVPAPYVVDDGEIVPMPPYTAQTSIPDVQCKYVGETWCGVLEHFRLKLKNVHDHVKGTFLHEAGSVELRHQVHSYNKDARVVAT